MLNYCVTFKRDDGFVFTRYFTVKNWTGLSRSISSFIRFYDSDVIVISVSLPDSGYTDDFLCI